MNPKIERLTKLFAKLPRVGNRAAVRIVLSLLQTRDGRIENLAAALLDANENVVPCEICGTLTDKTAGRCEFCRDMGRSNGQICIVRDMGDVWTLEKSSVFHGRYHIIGGLISGLAGVMPDDLNISTLPARIKNENITEIIFALPNIVPRPMYFGCCTLFLSIFGGGFLGLSDLSCLGFGGDCLACEDGRGALGFVFCRETGDFLSA